MVNVPAVIKVASLPRVVLCAIRSNPEHQMVAGMGSPFMQISAECELLWFPTFEGQIDIVGHLFQRVGEGKGIGGRL